MLQRDPEIQTNKLAPSFALEPITSSRNNLSSFDQFDTPTAPKTPKGLST
jgi:hypothetical protein